MIYRKLGNTGLEASQLGFGAMRLPMKGEQGEQVDRELAIPMIHRAFEAGVNYIDTAVGYCRKDSQRVVGEALKGWRDKIIVSTKDPSPANAERAAKHFSPLSLLVVCAVVALLVNGVPWLLVALDVANGMKAYLCIFLVSSFLTSLASYVSGMSFFFAVGVFLSPVVDAAALYATGRALPARWALPVGLIALAILHGLNLIAAPLAGVGPVT